MESVIIDLNAKSVCSLLLLSDYKKLDIDLAISLNCYFYYRQGIRIYCVGKVVN